MGKDRITSVVILLSISLLSIAANSMEKGTTNITDGEFISKVVSALAEFCPHQDLARVDNNTGRTDTGSCCTDFFYSDDTNSVTNQSRVYAVKPFQKCVFVQSEEPELFTPSMSYYVVVDAPPDGCLAQVDGHEQQTEEEETVFEPHCDDDRSPWRRWLPVSSKSFALIYKTPNCAFCHGFRDLIYWSPTVACEEQIPSFTSNMSTCDVFFDYPENPADVKHLQCFTSGFETCPLENNDNKLFPDIGLTQNELKKACHMDSLPPFNHMVYSKNLFCYICNYHSRNFPIESCRTYSKYSSKNIFGSAAFIGIINIYSLRLFEDATPTNEQSAACINFNNETECHQVMCPIGQTWVRQGKERECAFEFVQWTGARLSAILVLTSDQSITTDLKTILTERHLTSPWPREWKISSLGRRVGELPETTSRPNEIESIHVPTNPNATAASQLFVHLVYTKTSFNPKDVLQEVDTAMKKTWTLNLRRERIIFKQRMSRYKLTRVRNSYYNDTDRIFAFPMWNQMRDVPVPIGPLPIFELVKDTRVPARSLNYINNLFFCPQVQLPLSYFTAFRSFRYDQLSFNALYTKTTGYLFDNEFHHLERPDGQSYLRICVHHVMTQGTSSSVKQSSFSMTFEFSSMYLTFTMISRYWLR